MPDKYHTEWEHRDFVTDIRIYKAQSRAFYFLGDMAHDLDDAIGMLEGIEPFPTICLQLELLKRKCYYLDMANGIGNLWGSPPKGASGA